MHNRNCAFAWDEAVCTDRPGIFLWGWNSIELKKQGSRVLPAWGAPSLGCSVVQVRSLAQEPPQAKGAAKEEEDEKKEKK